MFPAFLHFVRCDYFLRMDQTRSGVFSFRVKIIQIFPAAFEAIHGRLWHPIDTENSTHCHPHTELRTVLPLHTSFATGEPIDQECNANICSHTAVRSPTLVAFLPRFLTIALLHFRLLSRTSLSGVRPYDL